MNVLCIGNSAIDKIIYPGTQNMVVGGAALRFVSGWALFRLPLTIYTIIGKESIWSDIVEMLQANQISVNNVYDANKSLEFSTTYNDNSEILDFKIERSELMGKLVDVSFRRNWNTMDLVHVCPFMCSDQIRIVEKARALDKCVSSMLHYSSLSNETINKYLLMFEMLDYLFLNYSEAQVLLNPSLDWITCGKILSKKVRKYVFLTLGQDGAAAFSQGDFLYKVSALNISNVKDTLGAGDCFAGGALAGLLMSNDPIVALRTGTLASSLTLSDFGSNQLLKFLKTA